MHSYIDPKDGVKKSSHQLKECRQFLDLQKFYEAMNQGANVQAYPMVHGAPTPNPPPAPQLQIQQVPQRAPPEAFPPSPGR
jgi:hypothetical protein